MILSGKLGNMAASSENDYFDEAIDASAKRFGFKLKKEQMLAIRSFMEGRDIFVSSELSNWIR